MNDSYEPFLHGVRGLMALWVFVFHVSALCGFYSPLIPSGSIAVDIFMFLSGFLMTRNFLIRESEMPLSSPRTILSFLIRRFFRIAPVYYLLLIVVYLFALQYNGAMHDIAQTFPLTEASQIASDPSDPDLTAFNATSHFLFIFGLFPQYAANNALPDWSISLEMQFYIALPFLLLLARRAGFVLIAAMCLIAQTITLRHVGLYMTPINSILYPQPSMLLFKIDCFMVGVLMARYLFQGGLMILGSMFILLRGESWLFVATVFFCLLALSGETATVLDRGVMTLKKILSSTIGRFFGNISYSIYLTHTLIIFPILRLLIGNEHYVKSTPLLRFAFLLCLTAPIVISTSFLLYRYIELPGIRLGRQLAGKVFRPVSALETA